MPTGKESRWRCESIPDSGSSAMQSPNSSEFQTICQTGDIPPGEARMFVLDDAMIGVFHLEGSFFALANSCPHAGASLAHGLVEGDTVRCRIHHWGFSIRDGTYLDADKPQCNVRTYPVRVVGQDVQVALDE